MKESSRDKSAIKAVFSTLFIDCLLVCYISTHAIVLLVPPISAMQSISGNESMHVAVVFCLVAACVNAEQHVCSCGADVAWNS